MTAGLPAKQPPSNAQSIATTHSDAAQHWVEHRFTHVPLLGRYQTSVARQATKCRPRRSRL